MNLNEVTVGGSAKNVIPPKQYPITLTSRDGAATQEIKDAEQEKVFIARGYYQRYPMTLYSRDGNTQTVQNEAQEKALMARGFSETPVLKASVSIQVEQQARTGAEMVALREARDKFDQAYGVLAADHAELTETLNGLIVQYEALKQHAAELEKQIDDLTRPKMNAKLPPTQPEKKKEEPAVSTSV